MSPDKIIKIALFFIVMLALLLLWIIPKTKFAHHFKMSESFFVLVNIIGIICGLCGLTVTFLQPKTIISMHLWELILIPFFLVHIYWMIIQRRFENEDQVDEKQSLNMANAGATAWFVSIPFMALIFILYQSQIINGLIWFPLYFFQTLLIYSASTLYYFKKY